MKLHRIIVSIVLFTHVSALFTMSDIEKMRRECQSMPVLSFDLDDVMSSKEKVNKMAFIWLGSRAAFFHPYIVTVVSDLSGIQEKGMELTKTMNGTSNIVHALIQDLNDQGYGDLSYYEDEIIENSVNPKPIMRMVENVRKLKNQGYIILGATNQDYKQYLAYRKHMMVGYGIDLDQLFNAVITTRVLATQTPVTSEPYFAPNTSLPTVYELIDPKAVKPDASYFTALTKLAKKISGCPKVTVIHTDDKKENTQAARDADLGFVDFTLAGGNARKTKPEEIEKTIDTWQKSLKSRFGIAP